MRNQSNRPLVAVFALLAAWARAPPIRRPPRPGQARWRAAVLARDGWVCTRCGERQDVQAHHLRPWASFPAGRLDVANGRALCAACHQETHHPRPPTRNQEETM
jgi:hypothetical protein